MDPIANKPKPYEPPKPTPAEARATGETKTEKKASTGPTGNAIMDGVLGPATPGERASIAAFALKAMKPPPAQDPTERKPVGQALIEKLTPRPTFGELLDEARRSSNPNATIGPIVAGMKPEDMPDGAKAKECKAVAKMFGAIPLIGDPIELEIEEACTPEKKKKALDPLPGVPITKVPTAGLPNTSAEGGDKPWKPIAK